MPVVSIILPTYKNPKYLTRSVDSVLAQSFSDWELIIIDDGLTQEAKLSVLNFTKNDQRIVIVSNSSNLGIQKSLNKGLLASRGKYIARLDDDDWWIDNDKLKKQVDFLEANPDYVLVGTDAIICDENLVDMQAYSMPKHDLEIRNRILFKNCFLHSTVLISKKAIDKIGGYLESKRVRNVEDYDLWLRLGLIGKMANLDIKSAKLIISSNSVTAKNRTVQARKDILLAFRYRNKYPHFFFAFSASCLRLIFFCLNRFFPIPQKVLYKIQAMYKAI